MSTGSFSDIKTTKVGTGGLNLLPSDKSQSPWIENLSMDTDGNWRPRHGLRLIRDFPDRICGLGAAYQAKSTIQKHYIYCATEASKLYIGTVNTIGAAAAVNFPTGGGADELATSVWSNEQKNGVFAVGNPSNPTSTEKLITFAWPGVSAYDNPYIFEQDGTKLTSGSDIRGVPFSHGNTLCVIQKATLQWSTYGDAYTWPASNYTYLPPEIGEGLAGMYWQEDVSYLFGTQGVCLAQGSPLEDSLRFRVLNAPPAVGGSGACITKCRDRIFYIAPGPTIFQVGGGLQRIDEPIQDYLKTYGDISNYQMFYDPLISKLVVHAESREAAIARMLRAVSEYKVTGIKTTLPFFDRALRHPKFAEGDFDTGFVGRLQAETDERERASEIAVAVAAVATSIDPAVPPSTRPASPAPPPACARRVWPGCWCSGRSACSG